MRPFSTSAPGRLCLFGEHQDYLGLPVIAMAMDRRCQLDWAPRPDAQVVVTSDALGEILRLDLRAGAEKSSPAHGLGRLKLMEVAGVRPSGMNVRVRSDIPIQAGCSSSTALLTAWAAGFSSALDFPVTVQDLVQLCHEAEVTACGGAGGDMDHFACAHGGLHRFGTGHPQVLPALPGVFVLGDSGEPKDTQGHLARCKEARLPLMSNLDTPPAHWSAVQKSLAEGTRVNRDLEAHWASRMAKGTVDGDEMGRALTRHHAVLRDVLGLSTPRIESMLDAAMGAGAWGGKINGSGGGGCMLAHVPDSQVDRVIDAICAAGGRGAWAVKLDEGVRHD